MKTIRFNATRIVLTAALFSGAALIAMADNDKDVNSPENQPGKVLVCHNGNTLSLSQQGADNHLKNHPGDYSGACKASPAPTPKKS